MQTTRGKILDLLRARDQTVNDLAAALRLTDNAVVVPVERWTEHSSAGLR